MDNILFANTTSILMPVSLDFTSKSKSEPTKFRMASEVILSFSNL